MQDAAAPLGTAARPFDLDAETIDLLVGDEDGEDENEDGAPPEVNIDLDADDDAEDRLLDALEAELAPSASAPASEPPPVLPTSTASVVVSDAPEPVLVSNPYRIEGFYSPDRPLEPDPADEVAVEQRRKEKEETFNLNNSGGTNLSYLVRLLIFFRSFSYREG